MLNQVHLVHGSLRDCLSDDRNRGGVVETVPRPLPPSDAKRAFLTRPLVRSADPAGSQREGARLWRRRLRLSPKSGGEAVAEIEVGDQTGCGSSEEPGVTQVPLDPSEGALR
jgi:hypothetical protein